MDLSKPIVVCKFGGGTLATREDFSRAARIINAKPERVIAVVSAVQGVTDKLVRGIEESRKSEGHAKVFAEDFSAFHKRIADIPELDMLSQKLESALFNAYASHNPRLSDYVLSFGERASAALLGHFLGKGCRVFDAETAGIVSNGIYGNASCEVEKTQENFHAALEGAKDAKSIVVTGFYGVDQNGNVNVFGRGGSDYSAGVITAVSGACRLELYKDVDGFLAADPRMVKSPQLLERLSFSEASELGYFGAKIIHPRTFDPLSGTQTHVEIRPVGKPSQVGTVISESGEEMHVAAIASRKGVSLVEIYGGGMVNSFGVAAEVFTRMARNHISVDAIATSQTNISFTIDQASSLRASQALEALSLERPDVVWVFKVNDHQAMVSVVGGALSAQAISRAMLCLYNASVPIKMTSYGASKISFSAIIGLEDEQKAVAALYSEFFGNGMSPKKAVSPVAKSRAAKKTKAKKSK